MSNIFTKIADLARAVSGKPPMPPKTAAIILAAGASTRMGGEIPKQLLEINGKPVMIQSLLAFEMSDFISEIVLVVPDGCERAYRTIAKSYGISKLSAVVAGGDTRTKSAANGFKKLGADVKFVAIHDAARCLVTPEIIDRVCMAAVKYNAATAATRSTDTIKISGKNKFVDHTEDRNHVWLAQTPQVFLCDLYRAASYIAEGSHLCTTDDNALIENVNHKVRLVECGKYNMKITTPEDLIVAEALLKAREITPPTLPFDEDEE